MDDRYGRSDFGRQERYQDFDHRDRSRYQDDMFMDRWVLDDKHKNQVFYFLSNKYLLETSATCSFGCFCVYFRRDGARGGMPAEREGQVKDCSIKYVHGC